jgi:branched-chain amino acid transport system substrate-binding protein
MSARSWIAAAALAAVGCRPAPPPRIAFVGDPRVAEAARMAVADVNAGGGIGGRPLEMLFIPEAGGFGRPAIEHAQRVAAEPEIMAVIGHASSSSSMAAAQIYNAAGLTQLAPSSSAPPYSRAGPYSFRMIPADDRQAEFLVRQIPGRLRPRLAVAYSIGDYGRGLYTEVRARLKARWLEPVLQTSFSDPLDSAQVSLLPIEIARARPDVLFWLGQPADLARVLPALSRRLGGLLVYAPDAFDAANCYGRLRGPLAGVRFVRFFDPRGGDPAFRRLRERFEQATGTELTYDAVMAYDAVQLLARAMRAGNRTRASVRDYIAQVGGLQPPLQGVGGRLAFDARRNAVRDYLLAEITADSVRSLPGR